MEGDKDHPVRTEWSLISIHSLRMEGDGYTFDDRRKLEISIHSLRMEGDIVTTVATVISGNISIHSLRMEGDKHCTASQIAHKEFQSTPSAWRETAHPSSFQPA